MDVSVIIVSYNSSDALRPCLESLGAQQFPGTTEVIVVDNASQDGTPEMVARDFPWVRLIAGNENVGYSRGVNVGIRHAHGRYFFILNPDTIVRPDSIRRLYEFAERTEDAGIVAPKLVFHDGNVQLSCRRFYTFKVMLLRRTPLGRLFPRSKAVSDHLMLDYDHNETRVVDWVLGAAMFVRRDAVETVGLMDERFFLYFEDVDWCYRMKQNGLRVYYHAESVVVHGYQRESAQSVMNRSFVSHLASLLRYYEKWHFVAYFMKRYREVAKVLLFLLLDVVAFNAAFLSAYYLRISLGGVFTNPLFPISAYEKFAVFENLLFVFTYAALGLYRIRRETRHADELWDIARAIALASVLLMASTYLGQIRTYSRLVVAFVVPFATLYDWGLRSAARRFHRKLLAQKVDLKRVCIVGPREKARELELGLTADETRGLEVVGIIDTDAGEEQHATVTGDAVEAIVEQHRAQEVIVLDGAVDDDRLVELVAMARRRVVDITVVTSYAGLVLHQAVVTDLLGHPVISWPRHTRRATDRLVKRAVDVLGGTVFLVVSAIPCVVYSLYALSRGFKPYSFSDRLGREGEPLTVPSAGGERTDGPSDLVNLPLYWLVVIGRMSLVGPYPVPSAGVDAGDPRVRMRLGTRPGVTGAWRMGNSGALTVDDVLARDAGYLANWSLGADARILLSTIPRMFSGRMRTIEIRPKGES